MGAVSLALWSGIMSFIFFFVLLKIGRLRINPLFEVIGVDFMEFGKENSISFAAVEEQHRRELLNK